MKKRIFYIAAILICLSLTTGGTLAYFNTTETATNVITTGGVSIDVLVNGSLESDSDEPIPVMPATEVDRSITVRSNKQAAWIRVNYTLTVYDAENKKMENNKEDVTIYISVVLYILINLTTYSIIICLYSVPPVSGNISSNRSSQSRHCTFQVSLSGSHFLAPVLIHKADFE